MRIRTIKPEYWQHSMHERLSREASILGAAIQNFADDEGRGDGSALKIKSMVVPCIAMDVEAVLRELEGINFIILYEVDDGGAKRRLFQVTTFARHQSISHPTPSVLPGPPGWVFVLDPKPPQWSEKKGQWKRGRWYREDALGGLPLGERRVESGERSARSDGPYQHGEKRTPGTHPEDSRSVPSSYREDSGAVAGVDREDSNLARARTGTGTGTGTGKGQGGEGAGAPPPAGDSDLGDRSGNGSRPPSPALRAPSPPGEGKESVARYPSDADVPTVEEVAAYGATLIPTAAPGDYAEAWHGHWSADRLWWNAGGRLKDWKHHFGNWWRTDVATWARGGHRWQKAKNGAENGGADGAQRGELPVWRQIQELERAILEHPANKGSVDRPNAGYQPRCSTQQKLGLEALRKELAVLQSRSGLEALRKELAVLQSRSVEK